MKPAKPYVPASMSSAPVVARLAVAAPLTSGRPVPQAKPPAPVKAAPVHAKESGIASREAYGLETAKIEKPTEVRARLAAEAVAKYRGVRHGR